MSQVTMVKPFQTTDIESRRAKIDCFHSSMPSSSGGGRDAGAGAGAAGAGAGGALVALNQVTLDMDGHGDMTAEINANRYTNQVPLYTIMYHSWCRAGLKCQDECHYKCQEHRWLIPASNCYWVLAQWPGCKTLKPATGHTLHSNDSNANKTRTCIWPHREVWRLPLERLSWSQLKTLPAFLCNGWWRYHRKYFIQKKNLPLTTEHVCVCVCGWECTYKKRIITIHYITIHYIALHCLTLPYATLRHVTLGYSALQ